MYREHEVGNVRPLRKEEGTISSLNVRDVAGMELGSPHKESWAPHTKAPYRLLNTHQVLGTSL